MDKSHALRIVSEGSGYLSDEEVRADLGGISGMTLHRWRERGIYPLAVKFVPGGRNFVPRTEHQQFKEQHNSAPRSPGRRPGRYPAGTNEASPEHTVDAASAPPAEVKLSNG
jgi:hypothetical protein